MSLKKTILSLISAAYLTIPGLVYAGNNLTKTNETHNIPKKYTHEQTEIKNADFNNDGLEEIVTANSSGVNIFERSSRQLFQESRNLFNVNSPNFNSKTSLTINDFNNDGKKDIATIHNNVLQVNKNNSNQNINFSLYPNFKTTIPHNKTSIGSKPLDSSKMISLDYNLDNCADILIANSEGIHIYKGEPNFQFHYQGTMSLERLAGEYEFDLLFYDNQLYTISSQGLQVYNKIQPRQNPEIVVQVYTPKDSAKVKQQNSFTEIPQYTHEDSPNLEYVDNRLTISTYFGLFQQDNKYWKKITPTSSQGYKDKTKFKPLDSGILYINKSSGLNYFENNIEQLSTISKNKYSKPDLTILKDCVGYIDKNTLKFYKR